MSRVYTVENLPRFEDMLACLSTVPRKRGQKKSKKDRRIYGIVTAFDIETSTIYIGDRPHSFMYHWQFQYTDAYTIIGRTWHDFDRLLLRLQELSDAYISHSRDKTPPLYVCFVHNLAFEWQFLQGVYHFDAEDCFFREQRKPLYVRLNNLIEFRCSYMHSNMTLEKFAENMGCETRKLDGQKFDYTKIRFPWTPLSEYELQYCINDVISLQEAITREMNNDDDNLRTLPLTSTGYVRRDCKKAIQPLFYNIRQMLPDRRQYDLLRRAFRGGDTHANRYRAGRIQEGAGASVDIESSYPFQLCTRRFPMSAYRYLRDDDATMPRILALAARGNSVVADYHFKNLRLRNKKDPFPYLPVAKCHLTGYTEDNGRILTARMCVVALTEVDLQIVIEQYEFDTISAYNAMTASMGYLPEAYRQVVLDYYYKKTQLKKVPGKEYEYIKSKNKLNSCYGMAAQQCIHSIIEYVNGDYHEYMPDDDKAEEELMKANFPYQWGVYCTAWARKSLRDGMRRIPTDSDGVSMAIYCDTDSIKYLGKADFTELNREIYRTSSAMGATAEDASGHLHYMGKWDDDGVFTRFVTMGAKRYSYEAPDGLHVTVSGVTHKPHIYYRDDGTIEKQVPYAVEELGEMENFKEGMTWYAAGGTTAVYNDNDDMDYIDPETGGIVHISPNVSIIDSTYKMTISKDYRELVTDCGLWLRYCSENGRIVK